jgi:hypothetical protein
MVVHLGTHFLLHILGEDEGFMLHISALVQPTAPTTEDPSPYARFRMKKYCLIREARYAKISSVLFIFNETGS